MIKVLSIAGSDPSSGAGIQLDLKVFQKLGAFGMAIPAALTAQNSAGVVSSTPVRPTVVASQIATLLEDVQPAAVKTGMLLTPGAVGIVARAIKEHHITNVIVDPVIRASSGSMLLSPAGVARMKKELLPLTRIVTPNLSEAEVLSGRAIRTDRDMDYAAGAILDLGPDYVLIKGGHRRGPAADTLYGGRTVLSFSTARRQGEFHGTGCALSAAITVFIARGSSVEKAVEKAKELVDKLLRSARSVGKSRTKYFQF